MNARRRPAVCPAMTRLLLIALLAGCATAVDALPPPSDSDDLRACSQPSDCVIACGLLGDCCSGQCGCSTALNKDAVARLRSEPRRPCTDTPCPAVACMQKTYYATCRAGRCVAQSGSLLLGPPVSAPPAPASCQPTSQSTLEGVTLSFDPAPCVFSGKQLAAGISIPWRLEVTREHEVVLEPLDAGRCQQAGPGGLMVFAEIVGRGQRYCLCDTGLCAPRDHRSRTRVGVWKDALRWDGRNFQGPSDTGMKPGKPFPPGQYTVKLTAKGTRDGVPFEVSATRRITVR